MANRIQVKAKYDFYSKRPPSASTTHPNEPVRVLQGVRGQSERVVSASLWHASLLRSLGRRLPFRHSVI
jgi:hypothetical protein